MYEDIPYNVGIPSYTPDLTIVAGDLHPAFMQKRFIDSLNTVLGRSRLMLFVPGNHEYYVTTPGAHKSTMFELEAFMLAACRHVGGDRIVYLRNGVSIVIGETLFTGNTLWTDVAAAGTLGTRACRSNINDYRYITGNDGKAITVETISELHGESVAWLRESLQKTRDKKLKQAIFVTHHIPTMRLFDTNIPCRVDKSISNAYYSTDMDDLITERDKVQLWCCGHDHISRRVYLLNNERPKPGFGLRYQTQPSHSMQQQQLRYGPLFLSNPVGYPYELNTSFDNSLRMQLICK
jgi:hypothetical protein